LKSDRSLKEDIEPIRDTSSLFELKPVQFKMKGTDRINYGFIAQDIEGTPYANLVYENRGGIKSVAYVQLIAVLTKHIQDLTARVEALEATRNRTNL
jgi:hypothetical protein